MSTRMALALVLLTMGLVGCGGAGAGDGYDFFEDGGAGGGAGGGEALDLDGDWHVTYECDGDYEGEFDVTITVSGDETTATGAGNDPVEGDFEFDNGEINGEALTWTRDYLNFPGDGGSQRTTYTLTSPTTLRKTSSGTDASGAIVWRCTGEGTKQ